MLLRGHGRYTDDVSLPGQAYAVDGAKPQRTWRDPRHQHRSGPRRCRACSRSIPRPTSRATARSKQHAAQEPRRLAAEKAVARRAREGQGALRRRPGGVRHRRDVFAAKDAAEAIEIDIDPLAAVVTPRRGGARGRAASL